MRSRKPGAVMQLLKPAPHTKSWADIVVLAVFGSWFTAPLLSALLSKPQPPEYKCAGPGFVDFGCAGGWEAVVSTAMGVVFYAFLLTVAVVAALRLLGRLRRCPRH